MARQPRVPGAEQAHEEAPEPQAETAASAGTLRAADVDPSKLRRAVLTADGWVCPERAPAPPTRE